VIADSTGKWHAWRITTTSTTVTFAEATPSVNLKGVSVSTNELSLYGVTSSFVILASISTSVGSELVLQIWDAQYSVILAHHAMALPASLSHVQNSGALDITLADATSSQAILVLAPRTSGKVKASSSEDIRSTILVVPITLPEASSVAGALGKAALTSKWIKIDTPSASIVPDTTGKEGLIATMRKAMDVNDAQAAAHSFSKWANTHKPSMVCVMLLRSFTFTDDTVQLEHSDVIKILSIVLQPAKKVAIPYPAAVVHQLLSEKLVSAGMVEDGLLASLQLRRDWVSRFALYIYCMLLTCVSRQGCSSL
jgi:hypothetical protein